jgi:membrane associated rhomboid family serine protease
VDAVLETVGKATWSHSLKSLRPGRHRGGLRRHDRADPSADLNRLFFLQLKVVGSTMGTRAELAGLLSLLVASGVRPVIDEVLPLAEARRGFERLESGDVVGKVVLTALDVLTPDPWERRVVLPVHDVNPTRRTPWVTRLLIAVNLVVFVLSPMAVAPAARLGATWHRCATRLAYLDEFAVKPAEVIGNDASTRWPPGGRASESGEAGCQTQSPPPYDKSPVLSVLFAMFLHGGWLHLLGNLLFLFVFGNNVEDRLGRVRYLVFYLACGYAATYGFALFFAGSDSPLVGASGAIAGVLGAYLVLFPRARVWSLLTFLFFLPVRLPAWLVLGSWFVLQYLYTSGAGLSEATGTAYLAHVIGFLVGAALVWRLRGTGRPRPVADPAGGRTRTGRQGARPARPRTAPGG